MTKPLQYPDLPFDSWTWGTEHLIRGDKPDHKYTCKILAPKKGRSGCLSLQYHLEKTESWIVLTGIAWILIAVEGQVATRIMQPGDIQNIEAGTIHRLMAVSDDLKVLEPSTPDRHAADKSVPKDVVRLHCVHGREVDRARNSEEEKLVKLCVEYTEAAIEAVERGELPIEHNPEYLVGRGAFRIEL
ncbi:MAG: hypothetical protein D6719_08515 [Candidatus Dadabacteria bacterium]|nr:MAG: hypothetical protein D6719_08515 [Candidatus Dadabacteria bacterium]